MDPSLRQLGALRKGGGGGDAAVAGGEEQIINPKDGNNEEEAPRDKQPGYKAIITFCAGCRRREVALVSVYRLLICVLAALPLAQIPAQFQFVAA